jgi:short chain dehydrogenase
MAGRDADAGRYAADNTGAGSLPYLRAQKSGAIVNVSSMGGQMSFPGVAAYSASKCALEGLSEASAQELAPFGIKVMIVEPGALQTNFSCADTIKQMPIMEAYQHVVGTMRAFTRDLAGKQDGAPVKAARALDLALSADNTPLRLQVGAAAIAAVRAHAEHLLRDLGTWEKVGSDVRVNPSAPNETWHEPLDLAARLPRPQWLAGRGDAARPASHIVWRRTMNGTPEFLHLPLPIELYFASEDTHDASATGQCFTADAMVRDEGKTIRGLAAIKAWRVETSKKYNHRVEPLELSQDDGKIVVKGRPGSARC